MQTKSVERMGKVHKRCLVCLCWLAVLLHICCCCFGHRKPNQQQADLVSGMLATGAHPTLVAEVLHRQALPVKPKDVYNMKHRLKFRGMMLHGGIMRILFQL